MIGSVFSKVKFCRYIKVNSNACVPIVRPFYGQTAVYCRDEVPCLAFFSAVFTNKPHGSANIVTLAAVETAQA